MDERAGGGGEGRIRIGPRAKGVLLVAFLGLFLLDFFVLRGDTVGRETVSLRRDEPATLQLSRVGETHTFEIATRERRRGEYHGRAIAWRLEGPAGGVVAEGSELTEHTSRVFDVTPRERGTYALHVEPNGVLGGFRDGHARVTVRVGDHRILARLFSFF